METNQKRVNAVRAINLTGKWDSSTNEIQNIEAVGKIEKTARMKNVEEISIHGINQVKSDVVRTNDGLAWRSLIIETDDGDIELTLYMKR
tara:strand:+ start:201 stop:470 length:270 start_codon:yes stop_codon:yes gene_type:complete